MLPTVQAESPIAAVAKLAREGKLPAAGGQFWVRIVVENDGEKALAISPRLSDGAPGALVVLPEGRAP